MDVGGMNMNMNMNMNSILSQAQERFLESSEQKGSLWQIIYTSIVLFLMFVALVSDRVGADMVMVSALTLLMAAEIITIEEGIQGFANEGLLTVLILFVVAAGIGHTGALDWYMGKLLGKPNNTASAQLRLMIPIAIVSAFLNNTPVVAVMIPIVQRWGKNVGVSPQQLLIPLSFASILGGTCTLIGTSTNLVVVALLQKRYPGDKVGEVGLFDLGKYGVPIAMAGMAYILIFSPFLIPGSPRFIGNRNRGEDSEVPADLDDSILLGARMTKWSAAVNRTVKRSGLRDTGGVYLVSVHRAATGNVHRAVGPDFVLNVDDILYFTGLVEGFGEFCQENGLEVVTNEVEDHAMQSTIVRDDIDDEDLKMPATTLSESLKATIASSGGGNLISESKASISSNNDELSFHQMELGIGKSTKKMALSAIPEVDRDIGMSMTSLLESDAADRRRYINYIQDAIRGRIEYNEGIVSKRKKAALGPNAPPKIVAHIDTENDPKNKLTAVAINTPDRPGLLLDISKTLIRLGLNCHRTEARVVDGRSLSLWYCEVMETNVADIEEIWSVMNAMLEVESGVEAIKQKGVRIIRAFVPKGSSLIGTCVSGTNFRLKYKAAIIAVQRKGKSPSDRLSTIMFEISDILVLQVSDDSPLLIRPPTNFYKKAQKSGPSLVKFVKKRISSFGSLKDLVSQKSDHISDDDSSIGGREAKPKDSKAKDNGSVSDRSRTSHADGGSNIDSEDDISLGSTSHNEMQPSYDGDDIAAAYKEQVAVWKDLAAVFPSAEEENLEVHEREFLTAMEITHRSGLANYTVGDNGLDKLTGVFLVSVERPSHAKMVTSYVLPTTPLREHSVNSFDEDALKVAPTFTTISPDQTLEEGDILWFSGTANTISDLRKIPGMKIYVNEEVKKINKKVHDRRLVQAVIARRSKLVGKTVKETRFRTTFGAAVISVHREAKRIQEHPGNIKLQAGDVLLLEAGSTFVKENAESDNSFALLAEVEDSSPPRLKLLLPALVLTVAMLAVYTAGIASLLVCGMVAAILMVVCGILSQQEVRDAINWEVYITIACAFGIGSALTNSGVAGGVADGLVIVGKNIGIGDAGLYSMVYVATFLISNVVTNNAAAALLFPIAMDAAEATGADRQKMSYILMLGASASFMSPFGYTTNLLIYGPGGYKYMDFVRVGTPMQIILMFLSVIVVANDSQWYLSWIITAVIFFLVSFIYLLNIDLNKAMSKYNPLKKSTEGTSSS